MKMTRVPSSTLSISRNAFSPVSCPTQKETSSDYAVLKQQLKQRGFLSKQPVYYICRIALLFSLLAVGVGILLIVHVTWLQLLDAIYLACVFTQIGLLAHEAGHRQMFHHAWQHNLVSLIGGNFLLGMSATWWGDKHNRHHSHPNQLGMDPDIEIPFLDFTGTQALEQMNPFRQFLVRHQAFLFLPALMTVAVGLQYQSILFLVRKRAKYHSLEWILMIAHFVCYFALIFSCLPFWQAVVFIGLHQAFTGLYLGSIFAPNHKGMVVLENESDMDFLHRQVLTSRNIHAHPWTDFWYGGLNYQIEHHLFPGMPRNRLKQAQQLIKPFCQTHAISYHETSALRSFHEIFQYLHQIGAPLRSRSHLKQKA
ncbi:delta fatty acid desaturase [Reticulibacter mediterranei]|uniref:Delta fatty acid desaturase n=1 Tax=Reticulibacter mediterranei TaxID=2778369 RepID=A0A8J3IHI2_9CHLR|nr:acyl-CoA desaturase [Reticulibacter mediterranei]GHO95669.1 delta fatty acid desaturase [Reticulibacter mediterranei]